MKPLQQTDSSKLLLKLFLVLAAVFVLPTDAFADGAKGVEIFIAIGIIIALIPAIIAFLLLLFNLTKPKKALILVSLIWFLTMAMLTSFFTNIANFISDMQIDDGSVVVWVPITVVLILAIVHYINNRKTQG